MSINKNQINNQLQSRGQFAQIPNEIWQIHGISNSARTVWMYLASEGPGWKSSYSNIARNIDMSVNTVRTAVEELVTKNMLISIPHTEGCDFELNSTEKWNVQWKTRPSKILHKGLCKNSTGAYAEIAQGPMQNLIGIQEELTLPIRSNTKNLKAKAFKEKNVKEEDFSVGDPHHQKSSLPENPSCSTLNTYAACAVDDSKLTLIYEEVAEELANF